MARLGSFDYSDFKNMAKRFNKALDERVIERWIKEFLLQMAFKAKRKIKKRTPVDSGHLRRNWQVGNVEKRGNAYVVEIFNNLEYALFVNNGHRTRDHKGWVEGRFMVEISMNEIERQLPKFLEKKQVELLEQILNGR
ncbi:HK97 gp10 family phage protein [Clostridium tetani]|uniref:HK97 gp10 family phage protein n=1 Tax=Clostridium tetani TaxID=1513 RepID=UPI00100BF312|nr:HK97 gp10 family phage protein [Clostridium tetani]RXM70854.1 HK97 gp10 family phage protein [Clostridium tetani]